MSNRSFGEFLGALAEARDITDVNIAAGIAAQEQTRGPARSTLRVIGAAAATIACATVIGDAFASSPIHAGIIPGNVHALTRIGAHDWTGNGSASLFGHRLPWGTGPAKRLAD